MGGQTLWAKHHGSPRSRSGRRVHDKSTVEGDTSSQAARVADQPTTLFSLRQRPTPIHYPPACAPRPRRRCSRRGSADRPAGRERRQVAHADVVRAPPPARSSLSGAPRRAARPTVRPTVPPDRPTDAGRATGVARAHDDEKEARASARGRRSRLGARARAVPLRRPIKAWAD